MALKNENRERKYRLLDNGTDKRMIWERYRFQDLDQTWKEHLKLLSNADAVAFENSMETSIRGINIILRNPIENDYSGGQVSRYLFSVLCHGLLCPDLFVARKGFRLRDESNNHRFYNLLFFCFYSIHKGRRPGYESLVDFIDMRTLPDGFYNEGSSFYHFGIVDALCKLVHFEQSEFGSSSVPIRFREWIESQAAISGYMHEVNFGDRDGTTIAPWLQLGVDETFRSVSVLNDAFHLHGEKGCYHCLRLLNRCDIGTQGHVHDDFGHFFLAHDGIKLLDPGIDLYSHEPRLSKKRFHNFPNLLGSTEIFYKERFERRVPNNKNFSLIGDVLVLEEKGEEYSLTRELDCASSTLVDRISFTESADGLKIKWRFFIKGRQAVHGFSGFLGNIVDLGSGVTLAVHSQARIRISKAYYYSDYGRAEECEVLSVYLRLRPKQDETLFGAPKHTGHTKIEMLKIRF